MVQSNKQRPNPDKPLTKESKVEEDLLRRYPLAERTAKLINDLDSKYEDSVVIGIEGEWGSGKLRSLI